MARRTLDRRALREQNEAFERQQEEAGKQEEEEEEVEGDAGADASGDDGDDDGGAKPKKKAAKKKAAVKKPAAPKKPSKKKSAKSVKMKIVWGVFSNSHNLVEEFPYPQKADAEAMAQKLTEEKKTGGPYFLQPVKKPLE